MKKQISPWLLGIAAIAGIEAIVIGNMFATNKAGSGAHDTAHVYPVKSEAVEGTGLKRLILTEKAIDRIDLRTAPVGEEMIEMSRVFRGEVMPLPQNAKLPQVAALGAGETTSDAGLMSVRVDLGPDLDSVAPKKSALVKRLDDDDDDNDGDEDGLEASPMDSPDEDDDDAADAAEGTAPNAAGTTSVRYFLLSAKGHGFAAGERVAVRLASAESGQKRIVVPYSAVIFDTKAQAWVYAMTAPMTYLRQKVEVETVIGSKAVLKSGPDLGTPIVTVGVAELWGAETGMGGGH